MRDKELMKQMLIEMAKTPDGVYKEPFDDSEESTNRWHQIQLLNDEGLITISSSRHFRTIRITSKGYDFIEEDLD